MDNQSDGGIAPRWIAMLIIVPAIIIACAAWMIINNTNRPTVTASTVKKATAAPVPQATPKMPAQPHLESRPSTRPAAPDKAASMPTANNQISLMPRKVSVNISGDAWLTRNDGGSDILRGLHVYLIKSRIASEDIAVPLRKEISSRRQTMEFYRKQAKEELQESQKGEIEKTVYGPASEQDSREADKIESEIKSTEKDLAGLGDEEDTLIAHLLLQKDCLAPPDFSLVVENESLTEGMTGADGKFSLKSTVDDGQYFIYAKFRSSVLFIDWVVPVYANGQPIKVNLFNENAALIRNFH